MQLVDIHHHIVYGVDDGARNREAMQSMLRVAYENGVHDLIATSHALPGLKEFPAQTYLDNLHEGQAWCDAQGWDMKLHSGSEIYFTEDAPRLVSDGYIPTLDETWYVLVEFGPDAGFERICRAARQFGNYGYSMILAHFERYDTMHSEKHIQELRGDYGVLLQMNTQTITGRHGFFRDRWVRKVLDAGYVDMVGTDAHNTTTRACNLAQCYEQLKQDYGPTYAYQLCGGKQREILRF